ncbi:MAG: serine/threonine protein kinase [Sandaracinus sp.]|nr:serine/threonine protein kinase [Sandaracinus sp.]
MTSLLGRRADGFHVERSLGRGGMGEVFLVSRPENGVVRRYALKRLIPELAADPRARRLFLEEARLAGALYHPNVVRIFDVGEDDEGPYACMELVDGSSLSTLIRRCAAVRWTMPADVAVEIVRDVALGLAAAHEALDPDGKALALVHRDVSPENVLVGQDGIARLADFGIAKALGSASETTREILKGKLGYMAPELLRYAEPSPASDLFALGVVLYEVLAGRRLYTGPDAARRILDEPPPDLRDVRAEVPDALVDLELRLLAKEPHLRPQSARELVLRLNEALSAMGDDDEEPVVLEDFLQALSEEERRV